MPMWPPADVTHHSPLHGLVQPSRALELVAAGVLFLFGLQFVLLDDRVGGLRIFDLLLDSTPLHWVQLLSVLSSLTLLMPRLVAPTPARRLPILGYAILREAVPCAAGALLIWLGISIGSGQLLSGGFGTSLGYAVLGVGLLFQTVQRAGE